ncbi:sialic acid-binding Ig-like lectin 14 isoform X2 [Anomaloglossus baeobatrachus]|uniref:sialic acid-binding Ig-like lectin 14 isoform X2 n=1 Tax=Anomaloglossus baeobatrachus TaxID=238106 RepID=UPI003F50B647
MQFTSLWISVDYLPLILITSQIWSNINCQSSEHKIFVAPHVEVQRGLCADVPCTFTVPTSVRLNRNMTGSWYRLPERPGQIVTFRRDSTIYSNGRFHLTGDVTRGDCSFYIEEPLSTDEGAYTFRIRDPQTLTQYTYTNIRPYVNVTDLTDKPTISSTRLVDGEEVTMTCTSPGRCWRIAPPNISWEGAMTGTRLMDYNIHYENLSRSFHSKITFTPRKSHNNTPLFCRVTFQQNVSTIEIQTLNVEYSPSIEITIEGVDTNDPTAVIVEDGDSVSLNCIVDSNPNASITWYKEDVVVHWNISDQIVTIQLINITESDAGKYQCSAMNEHGVTHKSIQIIHQSIYSHTVGSKYIILLSTFGVICLLLLGLVAYSFWRRLKNSRNSEAEATSDITDLRRSEITEIYDQLKICEAHQQRSPQGDHSTCRDATGSSLGDIRQQMEPTYTDLRRSEITEVYDQLKMEPTYTDLRKSEITEVYDQLKMEPTYTDLRKSEITEVYDQLKMEPTYTDLRKSEITEVYDQLKMEPTYTDLRRSEITEEYDQLKAEATYTDLRRSEITEIYEQLEPVAHSDTDVVSVCAAHGYENVEKQHKL